MPPLIGYHTSSSGGYFNAIEHAINYDLETFQFFLGSPRSWKYRDFKEDEVKKFKTRFTNSNLKFSTVHFNYLPNPSTPKSTDLREKTETCLKEAIRRCDLLEVDNLVIHIGSHKGKGFDKVKDNVIDFIRLGLDQDPQVRLLLETSAGGTNAVGSTFDELGKLIEPFTNEEKAGVCLDTCHVFAAGYDLRDERSVENTLEEFDQKIGFDKLQVVHVNDSKGELGEGKDRHANIGDGFIKKEGFKALMKQSIFNNIPFILETPSKNVELDIQLLKEIKNELFN